MKKTFVLLTLVLSLSGCATITSHLATYILSRYVGVWVKEGASQDDMSIDASMCVLQQAGTDFKEQPYRLCMEQNGWVLTPFVLK
jgi:uncharacterized protein YceK